MPSAADIDLENSGTCSPKSKKNMKTTLNKSKLRSSNGKQLSITSMFAVKRGRSPVEDSKVTPKKLKVKLNDSSESVEEDEEKHVLNESELKDKITDVEVAQNTEECKKKEDLKIEDLTEQDNSEQDASVIDIKAEVDNIAEEDKNIDHENSIEKTDEKSIKSDENHNHDKENNVDNVNLSNTDLENKTNLIEPDMERCNTCRQFINNSDIIYYQGHPQDAVEEFIALTNEKLVLASGDEGDIMERPQTNITGYSIFDREGHLCAIDGGLVESDARIYMSGYLKSICSESPEIDEESVPVKDVGPIIEWFIHGFDGGMKNCITLSTEFGEYNLMNPSTEYTPLMNNLYEKIWISKVVVEYLEEFHYLLPTYEDLLEVIREATIPELGDKRMTEEMLHKHAQFVCDQVVSLEADEDDTPLITLPCIRELIKLNGIKFGKRKIRAKIDYKKIDKKAWTKATTTPLVRKTFESFFTNQLDKTNHELVLRRKRCGICEACQLPDCGECNACRAMAKFGGHGRTKKACVRRLCPNMAVQQAEDSDPEDDDDSRVTADKKEHDKIDDAVPVKLTGSGSRKIKWIGEPVKADATKVYYEKVEIDGSELCNGDYVMVETSQANIPALVARVVYMWMETINPKSGYFHAEVFIRATDTVLGEVGDPREVFLGDRCSHGAPLSSILRKANVERHEIPENWFHLGGKEVEDDSFDDDGKTYFFKKYYERFTARFEDLPKDPECPNELRKHRFCPSCERKTKRDGKNIPKVFGKLMEKSEEVKEANRTEWSSVKCQDYEYKKGCGVFLKPGTFKLKNSLANPDGRVKLEKVDETVYPEYYRKSDNNMRGSNVDTGEPFNVGHIAAVLARGAGPLVAPQDILLLVRVLLRPENTPTAAPRAQDLNLVYWTDELREVPFSAVAGPCHLAHEENIPGDRVQDWLGADPNRFYFGRAYDRATGQFTDAPEHARSVGRTDRGRDKGKGKGKSSKPAVREAPAEGSRALRTLDVFAGCGGLSAGLHAAGVASCRWAVEHVDAAAHAYALNNPGCTVFREDCNALLAAALAGAPHSAAGLRLPAPREVELMCGGPPCQGFSGMNRFNSREYSNFKNSLVATYLSFCDYYRPKYFILENVRNFVAFKKGMVLKLTLRTLLDMGYQCTFGVLQAGNYGVPQTRRRLIIIAAAPGYKLPLYPEPTHVFSRRACSLTINIDGKRFASNIQWDESAPRRTCTIRDAMSDLPEVANGASKIEIEYGSMPESHFQRMIRSKDENAKLRDHICKNMAPLIQARISRIPTAPGSDWRDLPNISVTLSDGTKCKVLQYRHVDKSGRGGGARRGVCACASGGACDPQDRQENTLIPWCLPHTANRHNNWAGLYEKVSANIREFPPVRGVEQNLFFFTHEHREQCEDDSSSRSNPFEADMALRLANYLMQQGYQPEDVTILTAYSGQMFYLRKQRSLYDHLSKVKITVLDNYQGEESKIIVLSLVRNNSNDSIGFLGTDNRVCVALSRAREGFYIFGNIEMLKSKSPLWANIAQTLEASGAVGKSLKLKCVNHSEHITTIEDLSDFVKVPEGGCLLDCLQRMPCGHACPRVCHAYDPQHAAIACTQDCDRKICDIEGHKCPLRCSLPCPPCRRMVEKSLPCGHNKNVPCHKKPDDSTIYCAIIVSVTLPNCDHEVKKECSMEVSKVRCPEQCRGRLACGHACARACHVADDPHHERYTCMKPCPKPKKGCTANLEGDLAEHKCLRSCFEDCIPCNVQVSKKRSGCRHSAKVQCHEDVNAKPCRSKCARALPCNHFCKKLCFEKCGDCQQKVKKLVPECNHEIDIECGKEPTRAMCLRKCERELPCGHACPGRCDQPCSPDKCKVRMDQLFDAPCGHKVQLPCHLYKSAINGDIEPEKLLAYCKAPCGVVLRCGHSCGGSCVTCRRGSLHVACAAACHQLNICGHRCSEPCNQVCPPCPRRCEVRCEHSPCGRLCGAPCTPCAEPCKRACSHSACGRACGEPCDRAPCEQPCPLPAYCGLHPCRGLCGEPCPRACRQCAPDRFPTDLLGDVYEDDDKLVQLEDCPHIMDVATLDGLMSSQSETVQIKTCPFCRQPIINTHRYKDRVNRLLKHEINPIKEKVYGTYSQRQKKKTEMALKIKKIIQTQKCPATATDNVNWQKACIKIFNIIKMSQKDRTFSLLQLDMNDVYLVILETVGDYCVKYKNADTTELYEEFLSQVKLICEVLAGNAHKISQQQQMDIGNELRRTNSMVQLAKILSKGRPCLVSDAVPDVARAAKEAHNAVFTCGVFNEDAAVALLKQLEAAVKLSGIASKEERDMVVRAVGLKAGHWFKCPNGHFYCIGECGGASQLGRCPDCGETIGGVGHRLTDGNTHAGDMDNSQFAAWSQETNMMANFRLE